MVLGRRLRTLLALVLASAFCAGLVLLRAIETDTPVLRFLVWNLMLAWIPFWLALLVYDGYRRGVRAGLLVPLSLAWLAFFPNAPYVLTDFVHLRQSLAAPIWFDALVIASFAFTGLMLGFASLFLMQTVVRLRFGSIVSWLAVTGALALSSIGIYLGRFVRVNSWSVLTNPDHLLGIARARLGDPLGNPRLIAVSILFTGFLSVSYAVIYSLMALDEPERPRIPTT